MRTIDLDQLAEAITPAARLKDPLLAFAPRCPNTGFGHPLPQGLFADSNLMKLEQLLTGQSRTEVVITLSHQVKDGIELGKYLTNALIGGLNVTKNKTTQQPLLVISHDGKDMDDELAKLLTRHVYEVFGLPQVLLSDHDPKFASDLFRKVHERMGVD